MPKKEKSNHKITTISIALFHLDLDPRSGLIDPIYIIYIIVFYFYRFFFSVDTYESHEGTVYCRLHFKELFEPKAALENSEAGEFLCLPQTASILGTFLTNLDARSIGTSFARGNSLLSKFSESQTVK
jgi:hypothetical protein